MTHLQHGDYLALLRLIAEVSAACSLDDFRRRAVASLRRLLPSESVSHVEMRPGEPARSLVELSAVHFAEGEEIAAASGERERLLLGLARPHLIQAQRNAARLDQMQEAIAHGGRAMIALDRVGRVTFATRDAERLLDRYFRGSGVRGSELPEGLQEWVRQEASRLAVGGDLTAGAVEYIVERHGCRLVVRFAPGDRETGEDLVMLAETCDAEATALPALGLSQREAEVLRLVARGKTDAEIAEALVVSPRTVHKHLEHVYEKLGVGTRTAAVSRAFGHVFGHVRVAPDGRRRAAA